MDLASYSMEIWDPSPEAKQPGMMLMSKQLYLHSHYIP
jgi:hypothetical protein